MQNMALSFKPYSLHIRLVFRGLDVRQSQQKDRFLDRFVTVRTAAFRKLFFVAVASGNALESMDVDGLLQSVDFIHPFVEMTEHQCVDRYGLDDFRNMVYRSNYERFYCAYNLYQQDPWLPKQQHDTLQKLLVLCDCYNYLFDRAFETARMALSSSTTRDACYFLLLMGLIKLKKHDHIVMARMLFKRGLSMAKRIPCFLWRGIETASFRNAINLVRVISGLRIATHKRREYFLSILTDEHDILQDICQTFLSASSRQLQERETLLHMLFILTTVV